MASSHSASGTSLPKWQIAAIALGATGALGLGYWYFKYSGKSKGGTLKRNDKSVSLDETSEAPDIPATPLEEAQQHKNKGNGYFRKGKYDEAIKYYNKAIETCPEESAIDLATFYQNRAAAYEQLKKWSAVISDCTKALDYEITKDWENCLDDITAVCLMQNFQDQKSLFMADRVLKELGKKHASEAIKTRKPTLVSKQFIKTYFMSFPNDPVYQKLLQVDPPIGEGELKGFLRAKLAFATENYDDVIPACTEEINNSESESQYIVESLSLRGTFYILSGLFTEALADLKTIIEAKDTDIPIKVNALIKRGSLYLQLDNSEQCLIDFNAAAELGPEISDVYHHRGQVYLLSDKTEAAREDFEKAVKLNPDFAIAVVQKSYANYRYALVAQDAGMLVEAMTSFKNATKKFPNCSEAFVLYAQVLTERQEFEEAETLYLKAAEIEPKNASILVHRGVLHLQWKADIDKAIDLMKSAIEVDEKCEFAYETLGTVEVQRGNLVIAIDYFNKAIQLARTEMEMTHLFSLRDAAVSQLKITTKLGIGPQVLKTK
ncbi:tetratricopeptide repeat protein 6 [Holotrichia oblita]|uniref:Tetratricopeptide repeat protein 6 n=1 Tax=Holotrichia oblita TaxID=644536 RepID=A0ACB9TAD1_HOLOL|nr:tetratricopeptide repeat protein 6 [Holotrichia oblita]